MKIHYDRSNRSRLFPLLDRSLTDRRRVIIRWFQWWTIISLVGCVMVTTRTLQGRDKPVSMPSKKDFLERFYAHRRQLEQVELNWAKPREQYEKCTQDLQHLIQNQNLDWSQKRKLPNFKPDGNKRGGGVIVFWHNAKTGGTTVRKQCGSLPGVDYMLLIKPEDYYGGGHVISERLSASPGDYKPEDDPTNKHNPNRTLFVEMHGMNAPTVLDMESHLQRWRYLSKLHGTPLFVFTLLREPVPYSLSYFNFFHQDSVRQSTQTDLLRASFSRQCHTLAAAPGHNKRICALLYKKFYELFDWVGTTEKLTTQTLPLLQHLLRFRPPQERFAALNATKASSFALPTNTSRNNYNVAVPNQYSLHMESLSKGTIKAVKERTCLDYGLWEQAQRDYRLDMWDDVIDGKPS